MERQDEMPGALVLDKRNVNYAVSRNELSTIVSFIRTGPQEVVIYVISQNGQLPRDVTSLDALRANIMTIRGAGDPVPKHMRGIMPGGKLAF